MSEASRAIPHPGLPVRFLYLVGQLGAGGAERQLYTLVQGLGSRQFTPAVCVWNFEEDEAYVERLKALGVRVLALPREGSRFQKLRALRSMVQRLRPEVIHSYTFFTNFAAYWGAYGTSALAIGSVRSNYLFDLQKGGRVQGSLNARWPRRQIFNSYNALENARRSQGLLVPTQCRVVRNGVDLETFRPQGQHSGSDVRILGVGSLLPLKRWDRLITAAAVLKSQGLSFRIQIVGEGVLRSELEAQIGASDLHDYVEMTGYLPNIPEVMQQADFLVHPSDTEGCPNVVMEAMACGLPVVASRAGESKYLIEEGMTGFLVGPDDDAVLADRMRMLIQQPDVRKQMGMQGRATAEKEFGMKPFVDTMLASYRALGWAGP